MPSYFFTGAGTRVIVGLPVCCHSVCPRQECHQIAQGTRSQLMLIISNLYSQGTCLPSPHFGQLERTFWCGCTTFIPPALYLSTCVASTFEYHSPSCKLFHALLFLCRRRDALSRAGPCVSVALHIRCQWRVSSLAFLPMEHVV